MDTNMRNQNFTESWEDLLLKEETLRKMMEVEENQFTGQHFQMKNKVCI